MVPSGVRGNLGGLYNTTENVGSPLDPAGFAILFAWSISTSSLSWVAAFIKGLVTLLAWATITDGILTLKEPSYGVDLVCFDHRSHYNNADMLRCGRQGRKVLGQHCFCVQTMR